MSEEKKVSSTDVFKEHVQAIIYQELGVKVSKDKAWKLFKALAHGIIQHVCNIDGNKLSLAGIGTFKVNKSVARGKKAGLDENGNPIPGATVYPFVPRFRWATSSVINTEVEKLMGVGDHDDVEITNYGIYKEEAPVQEAPAAEPVAYTEPTPVAPTPAVDPFFSL